MTRRKRIDELADQVGTIAELVDRVDRRVEKIEMVTLIREPNSGMAADAYNGLRKQIIAAVSERNAHLHQLAQFDSAVRAGAGGEDLGALVRGWLGQAGIQLSFDPGVAEAFEFVGDGGGASVRVIRPAYIDEATGRVIQMGIAEHFTEADASVPAGAEEEASAGPSLTDEGELPTEASDGTPRNADDRTTDTGDSQPGPTEGASPHEALAQGDNANGTESISPSNQEQTK